jgi:hypothetical protein
MKNSNNLIWDEVKIQKSVNLHIEKGLKKRVELGSVKLLLIRPRSIFILYE